MDYRNKNSVKKNQKKEELVLWETLQKDFLKYILLVAPANYRFKLPKDSNDWGVHATRHEIISVKEKLQNLNYDTGVATKRNNGWLESHPCYSLEN